MRERHVPRTNNARDGLRRKPAVRRAPPQEVGQHQVPRQAINPTAGTDAGGAEEKSPGVIVLAGGVDSGVVSIAYEALSKRLAVRVVREELRPRPQRRVEVALVEQLERVAWVGGPGRGGEELAGPRGDADGGGEDEDRGGC